MPRLGLGISLGKVTTQAAAVLVVNDFAWKSFKSGELTFPFAGILTQDIKYSNVFTNTDNWQQATGDSQSNLTIGADTTIEDPFNEYGSFKITYDRSGYSFLRQNMNGTATSSTFSIYVKKIDHRYIGIRNHDDTSHHSVFDFDTETFVRTETGHVLTFEKIGLTGWYRLFDYHEAGASEASPFQGIAITDPNGNENDPSGMPVSGTVSVHVFGANSTVGPEAMAYLDRPDATAVSRTFNLDDIDNKVWEVSGIIDVNGDDVIEETTYTPVEQSLISSEGFWQTVGEDALNKDTSADIMGPGIVTNGSFSDGLSSWNDAGTSSPSTVVAKGKKAFFTVESGSYTGIEQGTSYNDGKWYKLTATVNGTAGKKMRFQDHTSNAGGLTTSNAAITMTGEDQEVEVFWLANSNSNTLAIARDTSSGDYNFTVDGVEIVRANPNYIIGTGWAPNGSLFTCSSGNANIETIGVSIVAGLLYTVTATVARTSGTLNVDLGGSAAQTSTSSGELSFSFTAVNTNQLRFYGGSFRGTIDNIQIKERSKDITPVSGI